MQKSQYYRTQAQAARRLAGEINNQEAVASLLRMVQDYDDIAEDLEKGAIEIRHPDRLPQLKHPH